MTGSAGLLETGLFGAQILFVVHENSPISLTDTHPLEVQDSTVRPSVKRRVARMMVRNVGVICLSVVATNKRPSGALTPVLSTRVQCVTVQEESVARGTDDRELIEPRQTLVYLLLVRTSLLSGQ